MRRFDCLDRMSDVRRSYQTAIQTINVFASLAEAKPDYLHVNNLTLHEIRTLAYVLHDVYFAKIFAAFESSIRHYWRENVRDTKPMTEVLIASLAGKLGVPQDTLDEVQAIRDFRNSITHDEHEPAKRYTIDEAVGHLNTFLARLPLRW
jgi:hypothetical protein